MPIDPDHRVERALYLFDGRDRDRRRRVRGRAAAGAPARRPDHRPRREPPARLVLVGGAPMDGPRHIWWNFVSSSKERIDQAKADWKAGRFDRVFGDETEFIPLPE